jgi:hypothetical protein
MRTPEIPEQERRERGRLKRRCLIRVRPSVPGPNDFEEVLETTNVSRKGIYFVSGNSFYRKSMRLFITCPYSDEFGAINREYLAEVVRTTQLPKGKYGVAAHLLSPIHLEREESARADKRK